MTYLAEEDKPAIEASDTEPRGPVYGLLAAAAALMGLGVLVLVEALRVAGIMTGTALKTPDQLRGINPTRNPCLCECGLRKDQWDRCQCGAWSKEDKLDTLLESIKATEPIADRPFCPGCGEQDRLTPMSPEELRDLFDEHPRPERLYRGKICWDCHVCGMESEAGFPTIRELLADQTPVAEMATWHGVALPAIVQLVRKAAHENADQAREGSAP